MARGNTRDEDDDDVSQHRHFHWSLKDIPRFEGQDGEQPFLHLMEFEDYLVVLYSQIGLVKYTPLSHNGSIRDKELKHQLFSF